MSTPGEQCDDGNTVERRLLQLDLPLRAERGPPATITTPARTARPATRFGQCRGFTACRHHADLRLLRLQVQADRRRVQVRRMTAACTRRCSMIPSAGITIASYHACILLAVIVVLRDRATLDVTRWRGSSARPGISRHARGSASPRLRGRRGCTLRPQPLGRLRRPAHRGAAGLVGRACTPAASSPSRAWRFHVTLRRMRLPLGRFADGFAPVVGIGIAIARVGCFLHGCCFGTFCSWPWGVRFPRATPFIYAFHADLGVLPARRRAHAADPPITTVLRRRRL